MPNGIVGTLVNVDGEPPPERRARSNGRQKFYDFSGPIAIIMIVATFITWGIKIGNIDARVDTNIAEISKLRDAKVEEQRTAVTNAANLATKADVQRVSDKVDALSQQLTALAVRSRKDAP